MRNACPDPGTMARPAALSGCPIMPCNLSASIALPLGRLMCSLSLSQYRRLVTACADHVSDPCSRLLLDSLARRHGSSYRSPDVKQAADWPNLWQDDSNDVDMEDDVSGMASPPASQADVAVASQPSVPLITDEQRSLIDNIQSAIDEGHCRCEESMEWLRNATPDVVRHVLAKMDMLSRPDAILDTFARALVNADTNFETCAAVIDCCLLPRVLALTSGPASRMLFEMVAGLAKQHTRAFVSHLLCPLLGQLSSPSQSELLGRITRDCLADQDRALLLQHALTLQSWTEETIKVVYILVQSGVSMTAIIASNLVACIATIAADQQLCKAVKFPGRCTVRNTSLFRGADSRVSSIDRGACQ